LNRTIVGSATIADTGSATLPNTVEAVRYIRRMRGGAQSVLMQCDDGHFYIVKMLGNPQGDDTLGAEYIATSLAAPMGVPVAGMARVVITEGFLDRNPQICFSFPQASPHPVRPGPGMHFGSRLVGSPITNRFLSDFMPSADHPRITNRKTFAGMLVFDVWGNNRDRRQVIYSRAPSDGGLRACFIDHGFMFGASTQGRFVDGYTDFSYYNQDIYDGLIDNDQCLQAWVICLRRVAESLLPITIKTTPAGWYSFDRERLLESLMQRLDLMDILLDPYRKFRVGLRSLPDSSISRRGCGSIPLQG